MATLSTNLGENDAGATDVPLTNVGDTIAVFFDVCNNTDVYLVINIILFHGAEFLGLRANTPRTQRQ